MLVATGITVIGGAALVVWNVLQWGVNEAVGDKIDNLNAVVIKQDRTIKEVAEKHQKDIEVVGNSVAWLKFIVWHEQLAKGGRLSQGDCRIYRALAKQFGFAPHPC